MYRDLWTFFWSRKLATILLVFLILLAMVGATVPQQSVYPAADFMQWQQDNPLLSRLAIKLKLVRLFESPLFVGCSLMLCLSLLLCSVRRMFLLVTGREERNTVDDLDKTPQNCVTFETPSATENILAPIERLLKKQRFNCSADSPRSLYAVRGRWGAFGSVLFHFSFLILLLGVVASTWARLEGTFTLTEGQSFRGHQDGYGFVRHAPLVSRHLFPFQFNFEELIRVDEPEILYRNRVTLQEENGERLDTLIRPFHALTYRGYTFYQQDHGFSPALVFRNKQGGILLNAFVALQTRRLGDHIGYEDYFTVPGFKLTAHLTLYPDADMNDGIPFNRSEYPENPLLMVKVTNNENTSFEGSVRLGESVDAGNFTIEFREVRYWSSFRVVRDLGLPFIYGSFAIGIIGYFVRLFSIREVLQVAVNSTAEGHQVTVSGSTEQNQALFSEKFEDIVSTLKQGVAEA